MEIRTFQQWSTTGYKINKGAKAVGRVYGTPVFTRDQVTYSPSYSRSGSRRYFYDGNSRGDIADYQLSQEDDAELADLYGIDGWGVD